MLDAVTLYVRGRASPNWSARDFLSFCDCNVAAPGKIKYCVTRMCAFFLYLLEDENIVYFPYSSTLHSDEACYFFGVYRCFSIETFSNRMHCRLLSSYFGTPHLLALYEIVCIRKRCYFYATFPMNVQFSKNSAQPSQPNTGNVLLNK